MAKENPYKEVEEMGAWKWMTKYHGKKMIFAFLFTSMFIVAPWVSKWRVEELWLRLLISGCALVINFLATFLHPYMIYRDLKKSHKRWQENYENGMYD